MVRMRLSETDEIAAELYLVPPARFVAARDQLVRQARAAGHRDLARELQALRRPTPSAWLINVLTRHQRARLQQLFALGRELRQAQTQLDGDQLRRLPAQREDLIAELLDWARRHAAEAGVHPTEAALSEVEETLHAGLVDLAAAAAVMSGHLVRPMSHTGFGPLPQLESAGSPAAPSPPSPGPAPDEPTEWRMWPVDDELAAAPRPVRRRDGDHPNGRDASTATAVARRNGQQPGGEPAPAQPRLPGADERLRRAEADLADAASVHWQREHDLAEAEAAMEAVNDRQEWLEQQRMHLRREKVAAEQDLAAARAAQRCRPARHDRRTAGAGERRRANSSRPSTIRGYPTTRNDRSAVPPVPPAGKRTAAVGSPPNASPRGRSRRFPAAPAAAGARSSVRSPPPITGIQPAGAPRSQPGQVLRGLVLEREPKLGPVHECPVVRHMDVLLHDLAHAQVTDGPTRGPDGGRRGVLP